MSATIAYSSVPLAGLGQIQFRNAFAASAASLNSTIKSVAQTRLLSVDTQAQCDLFFGEITATSGNLPPEFGYMIPRPAKKQLVVLDPGESTIFDFSAARAWDMPITEYGIEEILNMSSSARKDLFIAVTLPLLAMGVAIFAAVGGSYAYTLSASNRLDDSLKALTTLVAEQSKTQAVANQQISTIDKNSEESSATLKKVVDQLTQMNTTLQVIKSQKEEKL